MLNHCLLLKTLKHNVVGKTHPSHTVVWAAPCSFT